MGDCIMVHTHKIYVLLQIYCPGIMCGIVLFMQKCETMSTSTTLSDYVYFCLSFQVFNCEVTSNFLFPFRWQAVVCNDLQKVCRYTNPLLNTIPLFRIVSSILRIQRRSQKIYIKQIKEICMTCVLLFCGVRFL